MAELYTKFMYFTLSKLADVNKRMQSVTSIFSENKDPMSDLFYDIASLYMDQKHLMSTHVKDINPSDEKHIKEPCHVNVGIECLRLLHDSDSEISEEQMNKFFSDCRSFLITACKELKK